MSEIHELASTSSGVKGWSSLSQFLDCPAKAAANIAAALDRGDAPYDLYPEDGKPVATVVGSIYGSLVEAWLMGKPVAPSAKLVWNGVPLLDTHPLTVDEAWRLADARMSKGFDFGNTVATQVDIVIPESVFGLEITGNLDLVVESNGNIWIGDLKTEGRADANLFEKFSLRQQLWIYCLGYEIKTGVKPIGCFIDLIIKNKEPKIDLFVYEGLTDQRFAWLKDSVARVKSAMADPRPLPSLNSCIAYNRKCQFLIDGMCSKIK
jgi:hypothetical protein